MASQQYTQEPIALIGVGCRFPGSSSRPSKLWELFQHPVDVASKIPKNRFNVDAFYHPDGPHHGSTNVTESYFISDRDVRHFDAQFFNTPPSEADPMDPQHRQLLEVVYEALEDSGMTLEGLHDSDTAVYVGLMCNDYSAISGRDFDYIPTYGATGIAASNASSRISYFFNWHGPCMTIDTACSSSLIALHQAVQTLRSGTSKVAVAAGTNLILDPLPYVSESNLNMLSPTGRSRMWDRDADGYARSEGVAAVILKTLSQALYDGDKVDCIIRETGANQDGRTKGITMPSGIAQAAMICDTYARAGLDPKNRLERCQYFEAHGTGTPAGDPQEASALDAAFFAEKTDQRDPGDILFVGSAKTVLGHTEGTAGLAGVIKACLAIKHSVIPPNLLFNQLSPQVAPFYQNLRIVTEDLPWPSLPEGVPRRASVNSFGFGGSNAHAILESYQHVSDEKSRPGLREGALNILPFVFSAASDNSLRATLQAYVSHLKEHSAINLNDLRYTLSIKRSTLACRVAFPAQTLERLLAQIKARLADSKPFEGGGSRRKSSPAVLGVFTGQGAQWPIMGVGLITKYPLARQVVAELDHSLSTLPESDRPDWTILDQLSAEADCSRINEAAISQPLCTAVQLILVRILTAVGITFKAVVGHSSGEIAAAHVAGFLSAADSIRIAYYRGLHAQSAAGLEGRKGGMMAVGTSYEDALDFCQLEDIKGRITVAASNSSSSVTLSGDMDAIQEAKEAFDQEKKFTRVLKVNTAYHSHHMNTCADAYLKSLQGCNIQVQQPKDDTIPPWFSSVHEGTRMQASEDLTAGYWVENMTKTVQFLQALKSTLEAVEAPDLSLEVGPHPALKGPAIQTMQELTGKDIPYAGTLTRGLGDVESVANCLGIMWTSLGNAGVSWLTVLDTLGNGSKADLEVVKDLPLYQWDHDRLYWIESRYGKLFRTQESHVHQLLGVRIPDGSAEEMRWKNILKPRELPWLSGHALQGQIVFPATGYIALAMEAAIEIAGTGQTVQLIELCDLQILKAIAIDETAGTEIVVSMTDITGLDSDNYMEAHFSSFSIASKDSTALVMNAKGHVRIKLGKAVAPEAVLMPRETHHVPMKNVDIEDFYKAMGSLGYGYSGPFKGLSKLKRRLGRASGTISRPPLGEGRPLLFHPGMLDSSLQTLFAAFSAPGDARLWSLHVPTAIRRVTLVPSICGEHMLEEVDFESRLTAIRHNHIIGDVDVIGADGIHKCIEIDGLDFVPLTAATEKDDRILFSCITWGLGEPCGKEASGGRRATPQETQKALDCNRVALFYLRNLNAVITQAERDVGLADHHKALLDVAAHCEQLVLDGKHPQATKEWLSDTLEQTRERIASYGPEDSDMNILRAVGENIVAVLRNETQILEVMTRDGYLDAYYNSSLGAVPANHDIAKIISQIAYRYPHCNILEIGAGTGGATRGILNSLQTAFSSYTYTDISTGFFEKAREEFAPFAGRMKFRTLDITRDPMIQGYTAASYDIVVAANVLHATAPLLDTLKNVRKLLRPGGYLVLLEIVEDNSLGGGMAVGLTMGGLPGWWVGVNDGRKHAPTIPLTKWNVALKKSGFGGIQTHTPMLDPNTYITSIFTAQAVDDDVTLLQRPLRSRPDQIPIKDLVLIGGQSLETCRALDEVEDLLNTRCENLVRISMLEELANLEIPENATVLSLADVDSPIFKGITEARWEVLKRVCANSRAALWVTSGSDCDQPYAGAMVGLYRSVPVELMQLRLQMLELPMAQVSSSAGLLAELLLRVQLSTLWQQSPLPKDLLWTTEPELKLEGGQLKISRLLPDTSANDRYNSARRIITKEVDLRTRCAELEWVETTAKYALHELSGPPLQPELPQEQGSSLINVVASHSLLFAIRTAAGCHFIGIGTETGTDQKLIFLASRQASLVTIPRECAVKVQLDETCDETQVLYAAAAYLYGQELIARVDRSGCSLLVHEPPPIVVSILASQLKLNPEMKLYFTTCDPSRKTDDASWIVLHPRVSTSSLQRCLPARLDLFVDLSTTTPEADLGARISGVITRTCEKVSKSSLVAEESGPLLLSSRRKATPMLERIKSFVNSSESIMTMTRAAVSTNASTKSVGEVITNDTGRSRSLFDIIAWHQDPVVAAAVEPVDWCKTIFQDGKTYWMVGLAGDLGQSICDWMINHGARYIVLTSRNPEASTAWVEACAAKGARIEFIAGDIANLESLRRVHDHIIDTFPPIAGVANGALVLRDKLFINTNFADVETVFRPKVTGTLNLHELFSTNTLDWFIAFSSIVGTTGNTGQSVYSAANCFIKALINQRRRQGLVGSSIDISRVHGVGYVERETKATGLLSERDISKIYRVSMPLSEADLHQLFAEAVLAGKPSSGCASELITGIRTLSPSETMDVFWAANLKFSHFIHEAENGTSVVSGRMTRIAVKAELQKAKTVDDVVAIIKTAFTARLSASLEHSEDQTISDSIPLIELGMDSLVAVEIRSWMMKEVGVNVPVLKILGGASISDLVFDAVERLPEDFMSKLERQSTQATADPNMAAALGSDSDTGDSSSSDTGRELTCSKASSSPSSPASGDLEAVAELKKGNGEKSKELSKPPQFTSRTSFEPVIIRKEPMSYGQNMFWFIRQYSEESTTSNITFFFRMGGEFDFERLRDTLTKICQRHESLRTCFFATEDGEYQGIMKDSAVELEHMVVSNEEDVRSIYVQLQNFTYDLAKGDTFRAVLCSMPSTHTFYLVVGYHHIIMDGFSWEIVLAELQRGYQTGQLPPVKRQYATWAAEQRKTITSGQVQSERQFWQKELKALPPVLPLLPMALVSSRQPLKKYSLHRCAVKLDAALNRQIKEQSHLSKVSTFHFHLATYTALLSRFTDAKDLCIGMADANRMDSADASIVGLLLNLVLLRFRPSSSHSFAELLKDARTRAYAAMAHSKLPFSVIIDEAGVPRTSSHNPLFQAFIEYRQANKGAAFQTNQPQDNTSYSKTSYDITLNVLEDHIGDTTVSFGVQGSLYSAEGAATILRSYVTMLAFFCQNTKAIIDDAPLYANEDISRALSFAPGTSDIQPGGPQTVVHLVLEMAQKHKASLAVKDTLGKNLTYAEFSRRVSCIMISMRRAGVRRNSYVGAFVAPSVDSACSALAIMSLGAVYVPLDHRQGLERLSRIIRICNPCLILVDQSSATTATTSGWAVPTCIVDEIDDAASADQTLWKIEAEPNQVAAVLFTSGTTGVPKGIMLKHSGLTNAIQGVTSQFGLRREIVLQQTALSFDMSIDETFVALCNGGILVVVDKSLRGDSKAIMELIASECITYTRATPPEYSSWIRHGAACTKANTSWKWAFAGGDRMARVLCQQFHALGLPQLRLFNSYGPTEISLSATKMEISYRSSSDQPIPIGLPMPGYRVYIVDEKLRLVPPGVEGEILVGGAGVSLGYLHDAKLTSERFLPDPWAGPNFVSKGWNKMYRTGDRGYFNKHGEVMFKGRVADDTQIKVRGLRVELEDIEANVLQAANGSLSHAVCTMRGSDDDAFLVCHVVLSAYEPGSQQDVSEYLSRLLLITPLPQYMKPVSLIPLERMPLTTHHKIDRVAVAALPISASDVAQSNEGRAEMDELELHLAKLWKQLLPDEMSKVKPTSMTDFFNVGGNSLRLVELSSWIRSSFSVSIPLVDLMEASRLREMATRIREAAVASPIDWVQETYLPDMQIQDMPRRFPTKRRRSSNMEVILTGATGHFGRNLLAWLVEQPSISKVHCIAVRSPSKLDHVSTTDKVAIHQGDLTQPQFGLSEETFGALAASTDAIIHCAAARDFWESYSILRATNVTPAHTLVGLASLSGATIHFMSSGGVLPSDQASRHTGSASRFMPAPSGDDGYISSKWAAEQIFEAAARRIPSVNVRIYRTIRLAANSPGADIEAALPFDVMDSFVRAVLASRTIMDTHKDHWGGTFDLVGIKQVVEAVVDAVLAAEKDEETLLFTNIEALVRLGSPKQLQSLFSKPEISEKIDEFEKLPAPQWLGALKRHGFEWMIASTEVILDDRLRSTR